MIWYRRGTRKDIKLIIYPLDSPRGVLRGVFFAVAEGVFHNWFQWQKKRSAGVITASLCRDITRIMKGRHFLPFFWRQTSGSPISPCRQVDFRGFRRPQPDPSRTLSYFHLTATPFKPYFSANSASLKGFRRWQMGTGVLWIPTPYFGGK